MSASGSTERGEPNLTPILDMVFQLITFFMLVINFKTATMDMTLKLPVIGSAAPIKQYPAHVLVINVDKAGAIKLFGAPRTDIEKYIEKEAAGERLSLGLEPDAELPTMVVMRADKSTPFKLLYRVIAACQQNGFRSFSMKALNRRE